MAIQEQRTLPAPFIEDIGQDFAKSLIGVTGLPALAADISGQLTARTIQDPDDPSKFRKETDEELQRRKDIAAERFQTFQQTKAAQDPFAPSVVGQDPLQTRAATLADQGVGSFQDLVEGYKVNNDISLAAANIFHFTEQSVINAKKFMLKNNINVRL